MTVLWHVLLAWLGGNAVLVAAIVLERRQQDRRRTRSRGLAPVYELHPRQPEPPTAPGLRAVPR